MPPSLSDLLDRLLALNEAQLGMVFFRAEVPEGYIPSGSAPAASRITETLKLMRNRPGGLEAIEDALGRLEGRAQPTQSSGGASVPPSRPAQRPSPRKNGHPREALVNKPLLRWIHISDLHFGHGDPHYRFDQKAVTREILDDAGKMASKHGSPDAIFITGDVAFSAQQAQYDDAQVFLTALQQAVGVGADRIFIVPGNHDVDRNAATSSPTRRTTHMHLRGNPRELDEYLAAPAELEATLWPKLAPYAAFSAPYGSGSLSPDAPFWVKRLTDTPKRMVAVGLNTCLLSCDNQDGRTTLALGGGQLQRAISAQDKDALLVVLMHHPSSWLSDGGQLEAYLNQRPHILLSGHVHSPAGLFGSTLTGGGIAQLTAGAGHADQKEAGQHAYAWGELSSEGLRYWPRIFVDEVKIFRAGPLKFDLDGDGCHQVERPQLPKSLAQWLKGIAEEERAPTTAPNSVPGRAGAGGRPQVATATEVDFASLPALDHIDRRIFRKAFSELLLTSLLIDILKDAGMNPGTVHLSGPPEAQWGAALDAAKAQGPAMVFAFLSEAVRAAPGALHTTSEGGVTFAERLAKYGVIV